MKHREIRQLNEKEERGECPVCQIETLLSHGQPGFHVLRLVGNGDISAGKGRELLIDVLLGKIGLGDLPMFNAGGMRFRMRKARLGDEDGNHYSARTTMFARFARRI